MRQVFSNAWTAEHDAHLTPHLRTGLSAKEMADIAERINRTFRAVEGRFYVLKKRAGLLKSKPKGERQPQTFKAPNNGGRAFTEEDDRRILHLRDDRGATWQAIGDALKRTPDVVRLRYELLINDAVRPRIIAKRACLCCRVSFEYDRSDGVPLFMCSACRSAPTSPYAAGASGSTGRRAPRLRA